MKTKKIICIKIVIIVLIIIVYFCAYKQYLGYKYEQQLYKNALQYNQYQRICTQVGTTFNYIYVTRTDENKNAIAEAKYQVMDMNEKIIGEFETNKKGNGGLIGLENGTYYIQEKEVPEGYTLKNGKYKFIVSNIDNSFFLDLTDKVKEIGSKNIYKEKVGEI